MAEFFPFDWSPHFNPVVFPVAEGEIVTDRKTLIKNLKSFAQSKFDTGDVRTDDKFLLRFLKARKDNFSSTCDLYYNYYSFRQKNPAVFDKLNGQNVLIQQALRDGFPGVLDKRDRKGRSILVFIASRWNSSCYDLFVIYQSLLLSLEHLIAEEINQCRGFVFVIDWTEFSYKQSSSFTPRLVKLMIEGLQDCFPAKFKGFHFVNQPWYVDVALIMVKPFLKDKVKERIYVHGNNLGTLHEYIPKDVLPAELGGEGPPLNPLPWAEKVMSSKEPN